MNILVLCTGNSARSILLEAILNRFGAGTVQAYSAGSKPAGRVHAEALALLARKGFATRGLRSKSWDEFGAADAPRLDLVITVCGNAAAETCPIWPGAPLTAHWGVADPAAAAPGEQPNAFAQAYDILNRRAQAFFGLDLAHASRDELARDLAKIGDIE
jgi:protein-tyrosine-phosphatase